MNNYIVRSYRDVIVVTKAGEPVKHRVYSHVLEYQNITK